MNITKLVKNNTLISLIPIDFNLSNVILSVIYSKKKCAVKVIPITFILHLISAGVTQW